MSFFAQGDEEKQRGIPVGMLNDREKINRPNSQIGFIEFLVSPLMIATASLFPALQPLSQQLFSNAERWKLVWVEEAKPEKEEVTKVVGRLQKLKVGLLRLKKG
mmetsp:Transcript_84800/g.193380  ORF Transcript_84800/g.193380 Transcript_84800/m.193380 type:complete len:104 (-) Transcript_84800:8-319(-)